MLVVVVLQLGIEVGGGQVGQRREAGAGVVETIALHAAAGAVGEHGHVLVVGRVAQAGAAELAGGQGQLVDVLGDQLRALEGLRQQAGVVAIGHRQQRLVGADGEHALGEPGLGGQAEKAELVGHFAVALHQQGAGTAGATA
ncbi:hypothetical protein D3C86_1625440 [compost metagenome]